MIRNILNKAISARFQKGDQPGHPFRGNQFVIGDSVQDEKLGRGKVIKPLGDGKYSVKFKSNDKIMHQNEMRRAEPKKHWLPPILGLSEEQINRADEEE